ncbi:ABC transporter substrate-binding protein [Paroceanicella profunda]|uniref:ABC transporter substrate-binding protein n=1 Tax=Paroceanicella profunda TaxID=2579971 RepID=A0A5B8FH81_9RHOB|nr:ABC transporter substrate-binding protein [Paroceanicella profunda]QDL91708.1 ABC transporter substrate-binding protein [Paroceanicella profunda]
MNNAFQKDQAALLLEQVEKGRISRRRFTQAIAAMFAVPAGLGATMSFAQAKQLVLVNWGGDAMTAYDEAYGKPFQEETGIRVVEDGTGPTEGALRAQAQSGNVTWDVVDADPFSAIALGKEGVVQPIDYTIVDKSKFREGFGWEHATSAYFFSFVIAYNATKYDTPPASLADFFDVEKFPGNRAMYKWGVSSWEAALLADGVARDALYPLDLERAHKKIEAFKEHVSVFWGGGAELQNALLTGEADMAIAWNTRAKVVEQDTGGDVKYIWDDGLLQPASFAVMANNPGGTEPAMQLLAAMQVPERQLVMFEMLGQGPANPAADALIAEEDKRHNCVDPENMAKQIPLDMEWYAENYGAALDAYLAIISA